MCVHHSTIKSNLRRSRRKSNKELTNKSLPNCKMWKWVRFHSKSNSQTSRCQDKCILRKSLRKSQWSKWLKNGQLIWSFIRMKTLRCSSSSPSRKKSLLKTSMCKSPNASSFSNQSSKFYFTILISNPIVTSCKRHSRWLWIQTLWNVNLVRSIKHWHWLFKLRSETVRGFIL